MEEQPKTSSPVFTVIVSVMVAVAAVFAYGMYDLKKSLNSANAWEGERVIELARSWIGVNYPEKASDLYFFRGGFQDPTVYTSATLPAQDELWKIAETSFDLKKEKFGDLLSGEEKNKKLAGPEKRFGGEWKTSRWKPELVKNGRYAEVVSDNRDITVVLDLDANRIYIKVDFL
ncbi:MAG: hypothetical protein JXR97_07645 [Planctomycetes bacterium]|nr:hypothetical protein [Planctomycetota bacterium]